MDPTEARAELWRRYDAGDVTAREVETRLVLLERAAEGDAAAVIAALEGPIPVHRRPSTRRAAVAAIVAVVAAGGIGGIAVLASGMSDDGGGSNGTTVETVVGDVGRDVVVEMAPPPAQVGTTMVAEVVEGSG